MKHKVRFLHAEKNSPEIDSDLFSCFNGLNTSEVQTEGNLKLTGCVAQLMVESADIGAWAFHVPTKEFYFTEKWAKSLGYEKEDYHNLTLPKVLQLVHPDDVEIIKEIFKQHIDGEINKCNHFVRMQAKNGQWVGALVRGKALIYDSNNDPIWIFGVHIDLSEFLQSEMDRKDLMGKTKQLHKNIPGFLYQYQLNPNGTTGFFPFLSENIQEIYGCSAEDAVENPQLMWNVIYSEDVFKVHQTTLESAKNMSLWSQRFRINHPQKGICWMEGRSTPQKLPDGSILWSGYIHDDTEFQKTKEEAEMASIVCSNSQEGIIIADRLGKVEKVNPAFLKMTGLQESEVINKTFNSFCEEFISKEFREKVDKQIRTCSKWKGEVSFKERVNNLDILLSIDAIRDKTLNSITNYVAVFTDIGALKRHQKDLEHLANYDPLTNLPNRRLLSEKLEYSLEHAKKSGHKLAICFIDLDKFKPINDKYGHDVGDQYLFKLSEALLDCVRPHDTIARIGGDEFVVVLNELQEPFQMEQLLDRLVHVCSKKYMINDICLEASASIGVVVYPTVKGTADELLRFADQSMYKAKQQGRKRYVFFDQEQEEASVAHYIRIEKIKKALQSGDMSLWYQPKFNLTQNKISGVEALIRWKNKNEIIPAQEFVNIIIGNGLDEELGHFVLESALKDQKQWKEKNIQVPVSINISPDHLLRENFKEELTELINKYDTDPKRLVLEILETSKIFDFDLIVKRLNECIDLGVSFSLDDFGTGYSSLGYLRSLPIGEVKIDKSFVMSMLEKKEDRMIVQGIIDLSHALGRTVVAEGVETSEHINVLNKMGIDVVQGYEIAKPMSSDLFMEWMKEKTII